MKSESSLPYSQVPATSPCPEPTPSSPQTPSHFLKIHLNIILPSTYGFPQWSLSLRFPHQNPVHTSTLPHTRHMPRPSHSSRFYHPHNIRSAVLVDGKELEREGADWNHCFQERVHFKLCEMGMNLRVSQKAGGGAEFRDKLSKCRFSEGFCCMMLGSCGLFKFTQEQTMKAQRGSGGIALLFL